MRYPAKTPIGSEYEDVPRGPELTAINIASNRNLTHNECEEDILYHMDSAEPNSQQEHASVAEDFSHILSSHGNQPDGESRTCNITPFGAAGLQVLVGPAVTPSSLAPVCYDSPTNGPHA